MMISIEISQKDVPSFKYAYQSDDPTTTTTRATSMSAMIENAKYDGGNSPQREQGERKAALASCNPREELTKLVKDSSYCFPHEQYETLVAILAGQPRVLAALENWDKKWMLFALPSSITPDCVSVVVVPRGQQSYRDSLSEHGLTCFEWRKEAPQADHHAVVFVTPETVATDQFKSYIDRLVATSQLDRIYIDECQFLLSNRPQFPFSKLGCQIVLLATMCSNVKDHHYNALLGGLLPSVTFKQEEISPDLLPRVASEPPTDWSPSWDTTSLIQHQGRLEASEERTLTASSSLKGSPRKFPLVDEEELDKIGNAFLYLSPCPKCGTQLRQARQEDDTLPLHHCPKCDSDNSPCGRRTRPEARQSVEIDYDHDVEELLPETPNPFQHVRTLEQKPPSLISPEAELSVPRQPAKHRTQTTILLKKDQQQATKRRRVDTPRYLKN